MAQCPDCHRYDIFSGQGNGQCSKCYGTGEGTWSRLNEDLTGVGLECSRCEGSGDCPTCGGTGTVEDEEDNKIDGQSDLENEGSNVSASSGGSYDYSSSDSTSGGGSSDYSSYDSASGESQLSSLVKVVIAILGMGFLINTCNNISEKKSSFQSASPYKIDQQTKQQEPSLVAKKAQKKEINQESSSQAIEDTSNASVAIKHSGVAEDLDSAEDPIGENSIFYGNARYDRTSREHVTFFVKYGNAEPGRTNFKAKVYFNGAETVYTHSCPTVVADSNEGTYICKPGPYYLKEGRWEISFLVNEKEVGRTSFEIVPGQ